MGRFLTRLAISSAALIIASAGAAVALVFVIVAFYLLLASLMAPWLAALATAGVAVLFSVLVLIIARMATVAAAPPSTRARMSAAAEMGEFLGQQARNFANANSGVTLIALVIAGFAIGLSPKLRAFLLKLL